MALGEEYDRRDALGLAELVRKGDVSPAELLDEAIARAERVSPRLNAIVGTMYDEARSRAKGELPDGPFRGVPFLLKDLLAAYAGTPMRCGSRIYRGYVPDRHSTLVERYLAAGLVPFAKTSTPELGILPVCEAEIYGPPTQNPWKRGYSPGGSSGGSCAAVAAGIVPMAHASDGGGSIRIPASCCGVFGMKPSRMRTPPGPDFAELFFGFAVENVASRSVRDSAAALDVSAGPEPSSMYFAPPSDGSFLRALDSRPERLRIAFTFEPLLPAEPHVDMTRAVEDAAMLCESLGHHVEQARPKIDAHMFARAFFLHFAAGVASELTVASELLHRPVTKNDVEQQTWLLALVGRSFDASTFVVQRRILLQQALEVMRFFERYDVLLTPTCGLPPLPHGSFAPQGVDARLQDFAAIAGRPELVRLPGLLDRAVDQAFGFAPYTPIFNVTGQPSASVPLYWNADGLPIGTMFTARMGEDARLLRLAAQLEEARPWFEKRPPVRA